MNALLSTMLGLVLQRRLSDSVEVGRGVHTAPRWREVLRHCPGIPAVSRWGIDGAMPSTLRGGGTVPCLQRAFACLAVVVTAAWLFGISCASAQPAQLLSTRVPAIPLPSGANDDSVDSQISPDGRFIVFSSAASDLIPGHDRSFNLDVYLYDQAVNTTTLVSPNLAGTGGGDSHSFFGQLSSNGRFVLFQSTSDNLINSDTNGGTDIYLRDLVSGTTESVSVSSSGDQALGVSSDAVMTPDARYVVFISDPTELVPGGDTNHVQDVFLRDRSSGMTSLVSVGATYNFSKSYQIWSALRDMATPCITPDGRYVAFVSTAAGLVGTNVPIGGEVYVRDTVGGTTSWASSNALSIASSVFGTATNYSSYHPILSDNGRYLAFKAVAATNPISIYIYTNISISVNSNTYVTNFFVYTNTYVLQAQYANAVILQQDLQTGVTSVIDTNAVGTGPGDEYGFGPEMTPDGRFIAFVHNEPGSDTNAYSSVHVWDTQTSTDILVSDAGGVPPNTASDTPVITPDGRYVVFLSNATNLVTSVVSSGKHIYLRDLLASTTQLIDVDTNGVGSTDMTGVVPSVSADGRYVVFSAPDGSLVAGDYNGRKDVFLRDTVAGVTTMISMRNPALVPGTGNGISRMEPGSVSADGRWTVFESFANDLVPNDTNGFADVFVKDSLTGQISLVSVGTDGNTGQGGQSTHGVISADGRYVAFLSAATNLVNIPTNPYVNVFRRDLQLGTTELVSISTNGLGAGADCLGSLISSNGQFVTFYGTALNLAPSTPQGLNVFQRDMNFGNTALIVGLSGYPPTSSKPVPSASLDGRYVSYSYAAANSGPTYLVVRDMQLRRNVYTNSLYPTSIPLSAALSPDGKRLLYIPFWTGYGANSVIVDDIQSATNLFRTNMFNFESRSTQVFPSQWSSDGRYIVFVSSTNQALGIDDLTNRVYVCDLASNAVSLVSFNAAHSAPANGPSDMPSISGDGRFVLYRSWATDIAPGDVNPAPKIFVYDRLTQVNTILSPAQYDSTPFPWISMPSVSVGGQAVIFQSLGSSVVPGDLNRVPDAFSAGLDSDADGIPDWWMQQYFGHPTGQAGDNSRAGDDVDGDGMTNFQEYLNGTNPLSAAGNFTVAMFAVPGQASTATLTWSTVVAPNFQVQYKDELGNSDWLNVSGNPVIFGNRAYFNVPADQPHRFFRVVGLP